MTIKTLNETIAKQQAENDNLKAEMAWLKQLAEKHGKMTIQNLTSLLNDTFSTTVSSFSNRYGGWIIMGVKDGGIPVGVNHNAAKDMKRNFVLQLNNTNKMSPMLYLSLEEFEYEGKKLLWTYIPPACGKTGCYKKNCIA